MSFDPHDDLNWQPPEATRPRSPLPHEQPSSSDTVADPLRGRIVIPLVALVGLAALGALAGLLGVVILRAQMVPVTVIVDANARQTMTDEATVQELLNELRIAVGEYDIVSPPLNAPITRDLVVRVEKARPVTLTVDGDTHVYWTPLSNPADILDSAGLVVSDGDRVLIDGTATSPADLIVWPVPASHITLRRAMQLTILDGDTVETIETTGETVGDALFEAGITLYLADTVSPDLTTPLHDDMEVVIHRSRPVSIIADGKTIQTRAQGSTVGDALAEAGVALVGLDYAIPSEDASLIPGMHIRVIRVHEETVTEETPLPFETVYQADASLELDQIAVTQAGREGIQQTSYRVRYENGIEIGREAVATEVIEPAVNHVINYGTNVVIRTIDTPDGPREYWRVVRMYATSYHPAALGGDNVTATGRILQKGVVGVDRTVIPYGSEIYVPGYGVGVAGDTGAPRPIRLWVDLGYSDHDYEHWARYVDVYFLTPVPAEIDYILPPR